MSRVKAWIKRHHDFFPFFLLMSVPFISLVEVEVAGGRYFETNYFYYLVVGGVEALLFFLGYHYGMWVKEEKR